MRRSKKYHEGLICCSACLAGEVPRAITANDLEKAEESIRWHKKVFGDDYYLELQLHKATVERANHEAYPMQLHVNKHLRQLAAKHNVRMVCTNDVHFVDEDNAEAHDRLICLSTGKDLDDPKRMLYSKQEWLKTTAEMAAIFGQTDPEAMSATVDICNQVECYSIDHAPIMPNFEIPEEFGTEAEYRARLTEKDLFDEFTRDENGNVVMSEEEGLKKDSETGRLRQTLPHQVRGRLPGQVDDGRRAQALRRAADRGAGGTAEIRAAHHEDDGFPGLLPDRAGLHTRRARRAGRFGGSGPRIGRRIGRGLLPRHHADRPHRLRPAVRAFPEPPTVSRSPISTSTSTTTAAEGS